MPLTFGQQPTLVGRWTWGAGGGTVEIDADGSGRDWQGHKMQWTLRDPAARTYILRWSHGYTDTATLAADGNHVTAANNQGLRFTATRIAAPAAAAPSAGANLAGQWNWGAGGGTVEINQDGSGRDPRGTTLQWTIRDPAARVYALRWSNGYTDTVTLAPDGNNLSAVNNTGYRFTATRRTGGPTGTLDLNGSWLGGVHIWQDGALVLATATWKRDDGKYVIWRGDGKLAGRVVDLVIRYSPMTHGPQPEYRGVFTVSPDGNGIEAVYSISGVTRDERSYIRER